MRNIFRTILFFLLGLFLLYAAAISLAASDTNDQQIDIATLVGPVASPVVKGAVQSIDNAPFVDNYDLYLDDDPTSVIYMYVTVRKGNASDNTHHTWQQVNDYTKWVDGLPVYDVVLGKAEAIVQIGDERNSRQTVALCLIETDTQRIQR